MNNTFNTTRFMRLYKKHTVEHSKTYLLSAAVLAGLLFVCLGFLSYTHNGNLTIKDQSVIFVFFYLMAGCIFTSMTFAYLGDKKKAIPALTLPASHFEKYLVAWIFTFVVYQLVFIGVYFLIDGAVFALGAPYKKEENEMINMFDPDQKIYAAFLVYVVLHAVTLVGAVFFEKLHFIKTSFVVFAIAFVLIMINQPLVRMLITPNVRRAVPFMGISEVEADAYYLIDADKSVAFYGIAAVFLLVALLWAGAFFKLKEKEV